MTSVYRVFDAAARCMYVGCSDDPWGRLRSHAKRPDLPAPIAYVDVTHHATPADAHRVERHEIARLKPVLNLRSLRPERNRAPHGSLRDAVLSVLRGEREPVTTAAVATLIGKSPKHVSPVLLRLSRDGVIQKVGSRPGGHHGGRPKHLWLLPPSAALEAVA